MVFVSYTMQYSTIQYNTIQYNTIQYNTIQYNTIQYNTIQYNTIQYNTIQYNTIQYNTIQYNTMQCNAMQYSNSRTGYMISVLGSRTRSWLQNMYRVYFWGFSTPEEGGKFKVPVAHIRVIKAEFPPVPVRVCSTPEGNFIHLPFIKNHSGVLQVCLTGTAHPHEYCTPSRVLPILYTG